MLKVAIVTASPSSTRACKKYSGVVASTKAA